ncbi:hypothetical protein BJX99DRAFT_221772 [Aspergillus californicus]
MVIIRYTSPLTYKPTPPAENDHLESLSNTNVTNSRVQTMNMYGTSIFLSFFTPLRSHPSLEGSSRTVNPAAPDPDRILHRHEGDANALLIG